MEARGGGGEARRKKSHGHSITVQLYGPRRASKRNEGKMCLGDASTTQSMSSEAMKAVSIFDYMSSMPPQFVSMLFNLFLSRVSSCVWALTWIWTARILFGHVCNSKIWSCKPETHSQTVAPTTSLYGHQSSYWLYLWYTLSIYRAFVIPFKSSRGWFFFTALFPHISLVYNCMATQHP